MIKAQVSQGQAFERPAAGTYNAVCQSVHDVGMQMTSWQGKEKVTHEIVIVWEIDETIKTPGEFQGKRFVVSRKLTLSMAEKANLRHILASWRGKDFASEEEACDFDLEKIIGAPCMITLTETEKNGKTYQNVSNVVKIPKGMTAMKPELPPEHEFKWIKNLQAKQVVTENDAEASQEIPEPKTPIRNATPADVQAVKPGEDPHEGLKDEDPGNGTAGVGGTIDSEDVPF